MMWGIYCNKMINLSDLYLIVYSKFGLHWYKFAFLNISYTSVNRLWLSHDRIKGHRRSLPSWEVRTRTGWGVVACTGKNRARTACMWVLCWGDVSAVKRKMSINTSFYFQGCDKTDELVYVSGQTHTHQPGPSSRTEIYRSKPRSRCLTVDTNLPSLNFNWSSSKSIPPLQQIQLRSWSSAVKQVVNSVQIMPPLAEMKNSMFLNSSQPYHRSTSCPAAYWGDGTVAKKVMVTHVKSLWLSLPCGAEELPYVISLSHLWFVILNKNEGYQGSKSLSFHADSLMAPCVYEKKTQQFPV